MAPAVARSGSTSLAPSSIVVTTAALRFLYNVTLKRGWNLEESIPAPRQPKKLPVVLSRAEVLHFLGCVEDIKHQAILKTCYAAGLRISEAVRDQPARLHRAAFRPRSSSTRRSYRPAQDSAAAGTSRGRRACFRSPGLALTFAKPTLMSLAQYGTRPQRITSRLRSPALAS
jgi:hypothetical protein